MDELVNPDWAWQQFQPDEENLWDQRRAAHLFRRAAFGATATELKESLKKSPSDLVDELLNAAQPDAFLADMKSLSDSAIATGNVQQLSAWWVYRMLSTPAQALEKLTLFWHGHFATSAEKVTEPILMLQQNELLRKHAFGDFSQLLLEISRDPAMLVYLDSATNRKAHPNENFAREIMELFCLGEGQYSEADIRELARCFTGWEIRRNEFRFNRFQHDTGTKSILGQTGNFKGEDGIQIVLAQKSTAEFISRKLVKFYVMDDPEPDSSLIAPLAALMRDNGMQIRPVVQRILSSNLFFSAASIGRKIRSPVELAIGFLRSLEGSANSFELAEHLQLLGQGLLYPPSVKGWDGGRTWINSSTLLGRSNLVRRLITDDKTRFGRQSLREYLSRQNLSGPERILDFLQQSLFAVPIPTTARDRLQALLKQDSSLTEGIHATCTLPEFQLC
jgi:uncharacterized protein (DUF1800 family)